MGVRLIVEVLDHAPVDLTSAERLVLVVLAESANDTTREAWPGMEALARRSGLTDRGVRAALTRLAGHGCEVRVPLGKDKNGQPVYSCPGKRTTYRLPRFKEGGTLVPPNGGTPVPPSDQEWRHPGSGMAAPQRQDGGTTVPPFPHEPSGNPQQQRGNDERAEVLAEIRRRKPGASEGLIQHIYRQDGPAITAEIRERTGRQRIADWIAALADMPPCPHGFAGGDQIRPDTHRPQCALCRARRAAA